MEWSKKLLPFIDVIIDPGLLGHHDGEVEHSPLAEDPVRIDPLVVDDLMDQHFYKFGCDILEKLSPLPPLPTAPKYHRHFLSLHFFSLWTWNENDGISECQLCPGQVWLFVCIWRLLFCTVLSSRSQSWTSHITITDLSTGIFQIHTDKYREFQARFFLFFIVSY